MEEKYFNVNKLDGGFVVQTGGETSDTKQKVVRRLSEVATLLRNHLADEKEEPTAE